MQEQVNEKSVSLIIRSTKMTSRILAKSLIRLMSEMKKHRAKGHQGKQSIKKLVKQGVGVTNIEITDNNIKSFERVARKYGVDFALKKDSRVNPPKWLVFFKARDTDALTAAFNEFCAKTLEKSNSKPSLISSIKQMKEFLKLFQKDLSKKKSKGLER